MASAPSPPEDPRRGGDESFRRVVEYAPFAMVMVDAAGRIVLANAQTEALFGCSRAELIGQSVEMLVPERFRGHHVAFRRDFLGDPQVRPMGAGRDLFARRADGSEFPVEIGLNPIEGEEGVMVVASIVDITERWRAQQKLEDALREKTVLLNEIHHRVKNNLQMISSLLNLQAAHTGDPRLREVLNETQNRVRAMGLTHQLLYERKDFSRIDLGDYLGRLTQLLTSAYRGAIGRVVLRLEPPPEAIFLDMERANPCGLVVNELVTNAFKHAFPHGRRGQVVVAWNAAGPDDVQLTVADDGIGLPETLDLAAVKSLGLQLVPLLVDQLNGTLDVTRNAGTCYALRFSRSVPARKKS